MSTRGTTNVPMVNVHLIKFKLKVYYTWFFILIVIWIQIYKLF